MSNTAKKLDLPYRPNLQRLLTCRPSDKFIYYFLMVVTGHYFSFVFISSVLMAATGKFNQYSGEIFAHYLAVAILGVLTQYNIRKKIFTQVHLLSQGMNIELNNKKTYVPYEKVISITPPSKLAAFDLTSFKIILENGSKVLIPVFIERSEYILDALVAHNPNLINEEKTLEYRRKIITNDHMITRMNESIKNWKQMAFKFYIYPMLLLGVRILSDVQLKESEYPSVGQITDKFVSAFVFSTVLGLLCTLLAETYFHYKTLSQLEHNPNDVSRDKEKEKIARRFSNYAYYFFVTATFLLPIFLYIGNHF